MNILSYTYKKVNKWTNDKQKEHKTDVIEYYKTNSSCAKIDNTPLVSLNQDQVISTTTIDNTSLINSSSITFIEKSISFSGGGYNCVYHLGVVKYIFENINLFKDYIYLGASGGACIGGLILSYQYEENRLQIIEDILNEIISMEQENLKLHEQVSRYSEIITKYIDNTKFEQHIKGSNRCHISLTDITSMIPKNHIEYQFKDYYDYLEHLKASACIPIVLDNRVRIVKNKYYIDGGLSNNLPTINSDTIKISCLAYPFLRADIYPKTVCEIKYSFYHPGSNYIKNMYNLGYSDMLKYMKTCIDKIENIKNDRELEKFIGKFINDRDIDLSIIEPLIEPSIEPLIEPLIEPSIEPLIEPYNS